MPSPQTHVRLSRNALPGPSTTNSTQKPPRWPSSDFGDFTAAQPGHEEPSTTHALDEHDLLGSFDDLVSLNQSRTSVIAAPPRPPQPGLDLLGGDDWECTAQSPNHRNSVQNPTSHPAPIHVTLPPLPTEISPDYVPPRHTRRLSHAYSFAGPSSPPLVSDAGNDIVFHPSSSTSSQNAAAGMRHIRQQSFRQSPTPTASSRKFESSPTPPTDGSQADKQQHRLLHSGMLEKLATTTKLASKWKTVLGPPPDHLFHSPLDDPKTALQPIDITHSSPFATAEQINGSYVPPSGAPGFSHLAPELEKRVEDPEAEWSGTMLLGRREGTTPVLLGIHADCVSGTSGVDMPLLTSSLAAEETLASSSEAFEQLDLIMYVQIFSFQRGLNPNVVSLDQHGASLSTLYRLIDAYATTHRSSGNMLIVRDGNGHIFGVYLNEAIARREGTYYGSGESFMFKLQDDDAKVFRWTGRNQYFALCESSFISFGGGGGSYGLFLDSTFTRNSSSTSPAYDNEVLCVDTPLFSTSSKGRPFECLGLEVWGT
ncbi:hypothetical protein P7C73_g2131, partial [Tremellales sp. Uapishka_1]